jgi:hypothetical protein
MKHTIAGLIADPNLINVLKEILIFTIVWSFVFQYIITFIAFCNGTFSKKKDLWTALIPWPFLILLSLYEKYKELT